LYGLYTPDEGEILFDGAARAIRSPNDAIGLGVGMIHQHFLLVDSLTVAENVALGLDSSRGFLTDLDVVSHRIEQLASAYGLRVDPGAYVWQLSVGEQQRVEIIKALYRGAALLILDEPTAVLTPQEVDEFFVTLRQMAADGHALIYRARHRATRRAQRWDRRHRRQLQAGPRGDDGGPRSESQP
jgi:simple sugar transport system ATP-binding protein